MHQNVSTPCVYDIRSVKVHRGQSKKSQLDIQKSYRWNFQKEKGRKIVNWYVNVPYFTLTHSTPFWSLVHQSFRGIFVQFVSWDSKSTICKFDPKWAVLAGRTYELSLVSNCKTYCVIFHKITYRYTAQFEIGRHQIERTSRSAAFVIMQFCAFSMQIGNYRAYPIIPRNEFSKNDQELRQNPSKAKFG